MISQLSGQPIADWDDFVEAQVGRFRKSGLPPAVIASRDHWEDFLSHGYLDRHEDPDDFTVEELDDDRYAILRDLVLAYFRAGFAFFVPIALRPEDYTDMAQEFADLRDRREE
jgi:hypothetical protein